MDWIKKRYDQFILAVVAILLLVFAVLVFLKTGSFQERFAEAAATVPPSTKLPELQLEPVEQAKSNLTNPPKWDVPRDFETGTKGSLFVSQFYIVGPTGIPSKPDKEALRSDSLTKKPIPNRWFMDRGISFLEGDAATRDADKDGFANEDEWREDTDPNKPESHPPYYTKLFFKQIIRVPFRLIFSATNGDMKKPETLEFQINTVDLRQPSEFLKIGDMVPNTKFKLVKFEFKEKLNPTTESMEDVSELTLTNIETNEPIILVINKVTNSPDVYALFDYQWPGGAGDIRVKKLQDFALKPEADRSHLYKVIDVTDTQAVIQLPNGQKYTVVRDPRKGG
jgi:hypothetical protein